MYMFLCNNNNYCYVIGLLWKIYLILSYYFKVLFWRQKFASDILVRHYQLQSIGIDTSVIVMFWVQIKIKHLFYNRPTKYDFGFAQGRTFHRDTLGRQLEEAQRIEQAQLHPQSTCMPTEWIPINLVTNYSLQKK